jgi:hypothetical protein
MASEITQTKTKDRILTDQVYESLVDQHELRMRRIILFAMLVIIGSVAAAIAM